MQLLHGHDSFSTAYVVQDYPFGRSIRCAMRIWVETNGKKGQRVVSCTTQKFFNRDYVPGTTPIPSEQHMYNKPKASTYNDMKVLYLDENNHVQSDGISVMSWPEHFQKFEDRFGSQFSEDERKRFDTIKLVARRLSPNSWAEFENKS